MLAVLGEWQIAVGKVMRVTNPFETPLFLYLCLRFLLFPTACYLVEQCGAASVNGGGDLLLTSVIVLFTVMRKSMVKFVCF